MTGIPVVHFVVTSEVINHCHLISCSGLVTKDLMSTGSIVTNKNIRKVPFVETWISQGRSMSTTKTKVFHQAFLTLI